MEASWCQESGFRISFEQTLRPSSESIIHIGCGRKLSRIFLLLPFLSTWMENGPFSLNIPNIEGHPGPPWSHRTSGPSISSQTIIGSNYHDDDDDAWWQIYVCVTWSWTFLPRYKPEEKLRISSKVGVDSQEPAVALYIPQNTHHCATRWWFFFWLGNIVDLWICPQQHPSHCL